MDKKEKETLQKIKKQRKAWQEKCLATNLTVELPAGNWKIVDPCYLAKKPETTEKLGTAWDVQKLDNGGVKWNMFGDGGLVDSGEFSIVPTSKRLAKGLTEENNVWWHLKGPATVQFTCATKEKKDRAGRAYIRHRLEIHITAAKLVAIGEKDELRILANDDCVTEWREYPED